MKQICFIIAIFIVACTKANDECPETKCWYIKSHKVQCFDNGRMTSETIIRDTTFSYMDACQAEKWLQLTNEAIKASNSDSECGCNQ